MKFKVGDKVQHILLEDYRGTIVGKDVNDFYQIELFLYVQIALGCDSMTAPEDQLRFWTENSEKPKSNLPVYQGSLSQYDSPYIKSLLKFS